MKSVLIIGLGRFGRHLAKRMQEYGNSVMAIEVDEERANDAVDIIADIQIADSCDPKVIQSLGVSNFDLCFVTCQNDFEAALTTTYLLKSAGARYVVARASRDMHRRLLLKNGADYAIYTERDYAEKMAVRFGVDNIFDFNELTANLGIYEIKTPDRWVGKSIIELNVRKNFSIEIVAKQNEMEEAEQILDPHYRFEKNVHLYVIGSPEAIQLITQ
ncbi:MAG: TrkA family potassium uptake protein [Eubacteriales bacterium]|nr:TrkA family potassium uptake protein [Eubacteriales bacterium]